MTQRSDEIHIERLFLRTGRAGSSSRLRDEVERNLSKLLGERRAAFRNGLMLDTVRATAAASTLRDRPAGVAAAIHGALTDKNRK